MKGVYQVRILRQKFSDKYILFYEIQTSFLLLFRGILCPISFRETFEIVIQCNKNLKIDYTKRKKEETSFDRLNRQVAQIYIYIYVIWIFCPWYFSIQTVGYLALGKNIR